MAVYQSGGKNEVIPKVIGVYGVSDYGDTKLLDELKEELSSASFRFYDGADVIARMVPGGLESFRTMLGGQKAEWRQKALKHIYQTAVCDGKIAIVTGDHALWPDGQESWHDVSTNDVIAVFELLISLDIPSPDPRDRRPNNKGRSRHDLSEGSLDSCQEVGLLGLKQKCHEGGVLFAALRLKDNSSALRLKDNSTRMLQIANYIRGHSQYCSTANIAQETPQVDVPISRGTPKATAITFDGDKTLIEDYTGTEFWATAEPRHRHDKKALKAVFSNLSGYSDIAFQQTALLYTKRFSDQDCKTLSIPVGCSVEIYEEFLWMLRRLPDCPHVVVVVLTCGLARIWEGLLRRHDLPNSLSVVRSRRGLDCLLIMPTIKAEVVSRLRNAAQFQVIAFGESPLDLSLLEAANVAVVATGNKHTQQRSMDMKLGEAIEERHLKACKVIIPANAELRLS